MVITCEILNNFLAISDYQEQ